MTRSKQSPKSKRATGKKRGAAARPRAARNDNQVGVSLAGAALTAWPQAAAMAPAAASSATVASIESEPEQASPAPAVLSAAPAQAAAAAPPGAAGSSAGAALTLGVSLSIREASERASQIRAALAQKQWRLDLSAVESVDTAGLQLLLAAAAAAQRSGARLELIGAGRLLSGAAAALGLAEPLAAAVEMLP